MTKILNFLRARWKAIAPLALFGVVSAIQNGFDVHKLASLTGIKEFVGVVVVAALVHAVPNQAPKLAAPPADQGSIGVGVILRVLAVVCLFIFTLVGFDWVSADHPFGWLGAGLTLWLLSSFTD